MTTACWRIIGVWGDRSCPELQTFVHCSNCPVFLTEAQGLLDRPMDPAYLTWLTESVASRVDAVAPPDRVVLVFEAAGERFALDAAAVRVVAPVSVIRRLPHRADASFLGLVAVRGELLPCVSLAVLLGMTEVPATGQPAGMLIVVTGRDAATALLVDAAHGVEGIRRAETRPVPDTVHAGLRPVSEGLHAIGALDATLLDRDALDARIAGALG